MKGKVFLTILFIITAVVFYHTVMERRPWFGVFSPWHHNWLSGSTLKYSRFWYLEGPITLKFGMMEEPNSIEWPTLKSRNPNHSYLFGVVMPIYLISKTLNTLPDLTILMSYNLFNHFIIAFLLSLTVYFFLRHIKFSQKLAFVFSVPPIFIELLLPSPMYWQQNIFFADQAVILPYVTFVFLEVLRWGVGERYRKWLNIFQSLVFFYGVMTEWLFVFLAFVVFVKRIVWREKVSIFYWLPGFLAGLVFIFQIFALGVMENAWIKFLYRIGLHPYAGQDGKVSFSQITQVFWNDFFVQNYGVYGLYLCLFSIFFVFLGVVMAIFRKIDEDRKKIITLSSLILIPSLLAIYTFKNHSISHDFDTLRFSLTLALIPFSLVPAFVILFLKKSKKLVKIVVVFFALICTFLYLFDEHPKFRNMFYEVDKNYEERGEFIFKNTNYQDIVFSPNFDIPPNPPQQIAMSLKDIYRVSEISDIYSRVREIKGDWVVNIFIEGKATDIRTYKGLNELVSVAFDFRDGGSYKLYKISKDDFFRVYGAMGAR